MNPISHRLQIVLKQKQILTPALMQMVRILQLNRLELKDMIAEEIAQNPLLEEVGEGGEEITPAELQELLETQDRDPNQTDTEVLKLTQEALKQAYEHEGEAPEPATGGEPEAAAADAAPEPVVSPEDAFGQVDLEEFFRDFNEPGYRTPASDERDQPSFEFFLSTPVTLTSHIMGQLAMMVLTPAVREAADSIIGNLEDTGYLATPLEEIAARDGLALADLEAALKAVQNCEPAGVGARSLQECLLLQLESRSARGGVAWQIVEHHLKLVESRSVRELAKLLNRPAEHIQIALEVIRKLDPKPGLRYSAQGAREVEPDVFVFKDGDEWVVQLSDEDVPQLRLNGSYRRMLDPEQGSDKTTRNYVRERFNSALQLIRNIEQRRQTILRVCQSIVRRQTEFLERGPDAMRPMMIKEVAEEVGVHPSTVSRAVSSKYVHTPQGVFELRHFFSEAVQGPSGGGIPLQTLKRMVKKMIDEENPAKPLTDDQITLMLRGLGIEVTRRTVAKYREDMRIPSTHHRRIRN
ncbi:MAG: RNA polymerase factor sigma-54 [Bryobacteraceae bacterium]